MLEILNILKKELSTQNTVTFQVLNPDNYNNKAIGENIKILDEYYIFRDYKSWVDLSEKLFCKMLTPIIVDENIVQIRFKKLNTNDSFHNEDDSREKYGIKSSFSKINKNEEPEIFYTYLQALKNVKVEKRVRILNLGVNSGEEFELIKEYCENFKDLELVGIDYSQSAIETAKEKFKDDKNTKFFVHDINSLDELSLGTFDLIITIGTLQSCNSNFKELFMKIIQHYLKKDGSVILGFPNCRWLEGKPIYGAKAPNYSFSEMSILYNDVVFCKKYLQQKKFRVTITGKYYIFLTATSIRK
ncbi:class I SAM-dependent methyltransferase [Arcobacter arenosus]|nr:class I SAM-dependent methyltransferase [Arcobacter arenosus]